MYYHFLATTLELRVARLKVTTITKFKMVNSTWELQILQKIRICHLKLWSFNCEFIVKSASSLISFDSIIKRVLIWKKCWSFTRVGLAPFFVLQILCKFLVRMWFHDSYISQWSRSTQINTVLAIDSFCWNKPGGLKFAPESSAPT